MKMVKGRIILQDATSFTPHTDFIDYVDVDCNKISIPLKTVIRLYEGARHKFVKDGVDWGKFCDAMFKKDNDT